jgi:hypothetical protein
MTSRKVDYPALEREFITAHETPSLRQMAKSVGISNSTLSDYARAHEWAEKRQRFVDTVDEEFIRTSAYKRARKLAELSDLSIDVLEGMMIRAAEQISGSNGFNKLELQPRDVLDVIRQVSVARGQPGDITEERSVAVHTIDPRLLGALGELAGRALSRRPRPALAAGGESLRALPGPTEGDRHPPA